MSSGAPSLSADGQNPLAQGQVVPIVSFPTVENMARAMRLEGEVIQQNTDGPTASNPKAMSIS